MKNVEARSMELFESGYYCAESVLLAISEGRGIESELIPGIATGFCGGMSRTSGLCGALTGGIMALNMVYGRNSPDETTDRNYARVARLIKEFETRFGSANCSDLLGCDLSTKAGVETFQSGDLKMKTCLKVTGEATSMVARIIEDNEHCRPGRPAPDFRG